MLSLDFTQLHAYANNANGVAVPILLRSGANKVRLGLVDHDSKI